MSSTCTIPSDIQDILGPYVFGYQFNWALYGILIVQVYIYHVSSLPDRWPIQAIVYGTLIIETVQIAFATHDSYYQFAVSWGQVAELNVLHYTWLTLPVLIGIISMITQIFYAWRIHILSKRYVVSAIVTVLALLQGASALATGARAYILDEDHRTDVSSNLLSSDIVWLSSTAACDVLIFLCMVYYLSKMRTGIKSTEKIINRLITLVIETGLVTTIAAIIDLGFFIGLPDTPWFVVLSLMLSKLYSNSLLVILNNRSSVARFQSRGDADSDEVYSKQQRNRHGTESFRVYAPPDSIVRTERFATVDSAMAEVALDTTMRKSGDEGVLNPVNLQFSRNPDSEVGQRSELSLP
ncbi:hypothetical protein CONPUDRAFT_83072 [Coniophora puteana RWD-64-598 SS2]|uniref:DUF6534 domain-containing protein n=1 Tax=Coniophora puteana (strain RWD-64-598) TaxID=741705 RepID=A0A5M3MMF3_CONPW|nr:uncharacterized protein CONPUDRAFT_83072 [Coniophora puteana RWD-64-598 SS2]EIW79771.1 hypothetical protein CONPUDRAFT_83072 [Coniophora puteana RWD-64-598 SS2]